MRNIAHRGASGYAPENTIAAFDLAIEMSADAIETDVHLTRDGYLVLHHDRELGRTCNGTGKLADLTLAELQELDFGSWFGEEFANLRIQTLHETLDAYLPRIPFVLEIKDPRAALPMIESIPVTERIEVTSFDWDALLTAMQRVPHFVFGFLTPQFSSAEIDRCVGAGLNQICPRADIVTPELVAEAHEAGLYVRAWGISEREQVELLQSANVDGATCNWPNWLT